jgi:SAM-dependent methyltransferase
MAEIASAKLSIDAARLPGAGARVLDAGCGDGRHLAAAAARGCHAVGVDLDIAELRRARARAGGAPMDLIAGDLTRLPFRDAAFDTVICTETLEHLRDDRTAMREMARVMRDGAALLGAVPSHFTELLYWRLSGGYRNAPGGHVRIYRPQELAEALRDVGIAVRETSYVHFVDSLVWLRFCATDALRPRRARSPFEQAVDLAVAAERRPAAWRRRLRAAVGRSRFIGALDAAGALVWPKSMTFVGCRLPRPTWQVSRPAAVASVRAR